MTREPDGTIRGEVPASVLDISAQGARLVLGARLDVGTIHDFALEVEGQRLWVQAEVRHVQPGDPARGYEIGVEFVGVAPHDAARLRAYLERNRGG